MPYTPVRDIELIETGSLGKEVLSNDAFTNLSHGISGAATIPLSATDHTLTTTNDGEAMRFVLILVGTLTANVNLIVPAESRVYVVDNRTTGAFTVTCRPAAGGGVAVDQSARTLIYCDGSNVYPVASGTGGGGGSGAPTDASYLVGASHTLLSGERVVTNTPTVTWDLATAGQAKAIIPLDAVTYVHIQNVTPTRLLGRFTAGPGDVQEITPGTGLSLDAGTGVLSATAVGQPLDATLTALAGLATGANQLPYSTGTDAFLQTPLTAFARSLLDDADAATMRGTLSVQPLDATLTALAGVTTGTDMLPFFTAVDNASSTTLTAFMRSLLDDPDAATARSTLGVTGGGGGSSDFLGLSDTPDAYTGQAGKGVVVNGLATGLDFTTAATGSYDLGVTWSGVLPASQVLLRYPFPRAVDFPAGLTGSQGRAAVAATGSTTLDLRKNGTSVGSLAFAAAATTATFTMASATSFAAGDVLTVHAPASADATLADLGLSLAGTRAVVAGEMGATTFLALTDTPDAYTGQAGKVVRVNAGATATEYGPVLGTLAQQDASAVAITGGTAILTRLAVFSALPASNGDAVIGNKLGVGIAVDPNYSLKVGFGAKIVGAVRLGQDVTRPESIQTLIGYPKTSAYGLWFQPSDNDTGGHPACLFANVAGLGVGTISTNATTTSYNTTSDSRLKHAVAPLTGALDAIAALRPVAFRWNADESQDEGFLAHELQQVMPHAVTGEPDAVHDDGSVKPQQVDHSRLVPWLTAALQETLAQVTALRARVQSLEEQLGV